MKPFSDTSINLGSSTTYWVDDGSTNINLGNYDTFIPLSLNDELRILIKEVMDSKTIKIETDDDIFKFRVEDLRMWEADKSELEIMIALNITNDEDDEKSFKVLEINLEEKKDFDKIIKELDKVF